MAKTIKEKHAERKWVKPYSLRNIPKLVFLPIKGHTIFHFHNHMLWLPQDLFPPKSQVILLHFKQYQKLIVTEHYFPQELKYLNFWRSVVWMNVKKKRESLDAH